MQEIHIDKLITKDVVCTHPDVELMEVIHTMREKRFSCMVVTQDDEPVGIITERDMVHILSDVLEEPPDKVLHAVDFMTSPAISIHEHATLFEALVLVRSHKIRHLPVVNDDGKLVGLVTQSDLVHAHFHIIEVQSEIIEHSVSERTRDLEEANEQLKALSMEDALLGIGNRRAMEVDLEYTHHASVRYHKPYSVMLIDVDSFKLYNDHYGHQAGDEALIKVADHCLEMIRRSDRLYRYGGEELLLLLPETEMQGALILATRLIEGLAQLQIPHCKSSYKVITASAGVAGRYSDEKAPEQWQDVVALADERLYRAKDNGRNRVVAA